MEIQSLETIKSNLDRLLSSNPRRSLSGVFKALRKDSRVSLIGDYLLLAFILNYGYFRSPQYKWTRSQVLYAVRISGFYKDEGRKQAYIPDEWRIYIKENERT